MQIPNQPSSEFEAFNPKFRQVWLSSIEKLKPEERYRKPLPLGECQYPEEGKFDFKVIQDGKEINLHTYLYPPKTQPRAIVIVFHGLNSNIPNSAHIAAAYAENGCIVTGFDNRGFGKSEGVRGVIESVQQHLDDSLKFVNIVTEHYKDLKLPIFLSGQSFGGMTSYQLALREPFRYRGVILAAPALRDNSTYQYFGKMAARFLGTVAPRMPVANPTYDSASKNPLVGESSATNPLNYTGKILPGSVKAVLNGFDISEKTFSQFHTPFVVIQGGIDKLVDPFAAFDLEKESPSKDKTLIFRQNMWHNVWAEEEVTGIIPEIVEWVIKRC